MAARVDNLRESTDRTVRVVALGHLADAAAAHARLLKSSDTEALHDFRVALRRLRSWERAFRPYFKGDLAKKLRRRLRDVARDTNTSRDLEVHIDWLSNQRRSLGRRQRPGLNWVMEQLEQQKAEADDVLDRDVDDRFNRLERRLARALGTYRERVRLRKDGRPARLPAFADALAPRVRRAAQELHAHLALVTSVRDEREAHDARIAAKRLRYLLEPITRIVTGTGELVEGLKVLQDILGDMHDAQVFGDEIGKLASRAVAETGIGTAGAGLGVGVATSAAIEPTPSPLEPAPAPVEVTAERERPTPAAPSDTPAGAERPGPREAGDTVDGFSFGEQIRRAPNADLMPGIAALMDRLRERATVAYNQFAAQWIGEPAVPFFRDIDAVADRIAAAAREGIEIERKYLLRFVPEEARDGRRLDIAQGYLPGSRVYERIRRVSVQHGSGRKEVRFYRTVKFGEGVTRTEIEEETTEAIFLALWPLTRRRRLRKRRFQVDIDGRTWEIDDFKNRDLVLAEIELESEDEEVTFPDWLAPAVQREVTGEPEFQNASLAR